MAAGGYSRLPGAGGLRSLTSHGARVSESCIAVIGAGVAGAVTAICLRRSWPDARVLLVDMGPAADRSGIRRRRRAPESLTPAGVACLADLGLAERLPGDGHLRSQGTESCWGGQRPGFNDFWLDVFGEGYHLDRAALDSSLQAEAQACGVELLPDCRLLSASYDTAASNVTLRLKSAGASWTITPDFAVDATGPRAVLARRLGVARNMLDKLIALSGHFPSSAMDSKGQRGLVEAVDYGWWYAAPVPGGGLGVSLLTDIETLQAAGLRAPRVWMDRLMRTGRISGKLSGAGICAPPDSLEVRTAPSMILSTVAGQGWLAVGDAACSYDPLTSAGIPKALQQAQASAQAITALIREGERAALAQYQSDVFDEFSRYAALRRDLYAREVRFQDCAFWRRRLALRTGGVT